MQRKRIDKLAEFLNLDALEKDQIEPFALGSAYSRLFDALHSMKKFNDILKELEIAGQYIGEEHLDPSTLLIMKFGTDDFNRNFRMMLLRMVNDFDSPRNEKTP